MPLSGLTYNQLNNNLTSQAATMVTNGLPNDVLSNLDPLALIIFIPIFDKLVSSCPHLCTRPLMIADASSTQH
jgi:dipeptide/tripeptide permease